MTGSNSVTVDASNTRQLESWDGGEGEYWAAHADHFDRSLRPYHERLLAAAAIEPDHRVLDVGCGAGQTTRDAARAASAGAALGVDLSGPMLSVARSRAADEGVGNATFVQADAQVHDFGALAFDLVISRAGGMFFGDPVAAYANICGAVRPGGRVVLVAWQPMIENEWIREVFAALAAGRDMPGPPPNSPGPFGLSDPDRVRTILTEAGFTGVELEGLREQMWLGDDQGDARAGVLGSVGWMLEGLDDAGRAAALEALDRLIAAHETTEGVIFGSAAWLIRASRP